MVSDDYLVNTIAAMAPLCLTVIAGLILLLCGAFCAGGGKHFFNRRLLIAGVCISGIVLSSPFFLLSVLGGSEAGISSELLACDPLTFFGNFLLFASLFVVALLYMKRLDGVANILEWDFLMLMAVGGSMLMVASKDMLVLFLGLELLSFPLYVMAAAARKEKASSEAGLKYFLLGAFSSAFLLYGMSMLYGAYGSIRFSEMVAVQSLSMPLVVFGMTLVITGLAFKLALVPFHFWVADVYQGSPTPFVVLMATVVKVGALLGLLRVAMLMVASQSVLPELLGYWSYVVAVLAGVSIIVGNFLALGQDSVKRLLAYSSVSHAGFMMLGFLDLTSASISGALFYLLVYVLMTLIVFSGVLVVSSGTERLYDRDSLESFRGFGRRSPFFAAVITIGILSLAGLPPFAGFWGKLFVLRSAMESGHLGLVVIGALSSIVALYYYLRIVFVMYYMPSADNERDNSGDIGGEAGDAVGLGVSFLEIVLFSLLSLVLLVLGILPSIGSRITEIAAQGLFS